MKVVSARITEKPKSLFSDMPRVYVTLEGGKEMFLFEYFPDEIKFSPQEFIGLTISDCIRLKFQKDKEFLTS